MQNSTSTSRRALSQLKHIISNMSPYTKEHRSILAVSYLYPIPLLHTPQLSSYNFNYLPWPTSSRTPSWPPRPTPMRGVPLEYVKCGKLGSSDQQAPPRILELGTWSRKIRDHLHLRREIFIPLPYTNQPLRDYFVLNSRLIARMRAFPTPTTSPI